MRSGMVTPAYERRLVQLGHRSLAGDVFSVCGEKTQGVARRREHEFLVVETQAECEKNLPLGIHATVHSLLDAVDRSKRNFRPSCQLGLCHQPMLTHLSDPIGLEHAAGLERFGGFGGNGHLRSLLASRAAELLTDCRVDLAPVFGRSQIFFRDRGTSPCRSQSRRHRFWRILKNRLKNKYLEIGHPSVLGRAARRPRIEAGGLC